MRNLHLVDSSDQTNKDEDGYDPLYKIQPLLDHLSADFLLYYQPSQCMSVDEMMIGTRCRISFLQYLPQKPAKFGIKVFVNSEAKTGYVLTSQGYTGKTDTDDDSKGLAHRVVMELVQPFLRKGHWVFTENFYMSPALYIDFLKHKTYATGTIRSNCKNFSQILKDPQKMDVGNYHFATCQDLLAARWHDRKDVYMLSTEHNTLVSSVMKRPKGSREKSLFPAQLAFRTIILSWGSGSY